MSKFNEICKGIFAQHDRKLPQSILDEIMRTTYAATRHSGGKSKKEFIKRVQKIEKMLAS